MKMASLSIVAILSLLSVLKFGVAFQPTTTSVPHKHATSRSALFRRVVCPSASNGKNLGRTRPGDAFRHSFERLRRGNNFRKKSRSFTALDMVFTTPASVIEQTSTKMLLDELINESVRNTARNPIIMQFDPSSGNIWRRWKGTIFSETWQACVRNMGIAGLVSILFHFNKTAFLTNLQGFNILWGQLLSVTTFTLTFFMNQSFTFWKKCLTHSRTIQGRLLDINMSACVHAARSSPKKTEDGQYEFSTYTEPARQVLELMARYVRVFNMLTYASFTGSHRPLLTLQGMRRLVDRGVITEAERTILSDPQLPVTQRHSTLLMWIARLCVDARKAGHMGGGDGFEMQFLDKIHVTRAQYGAIGDELQGRMPLAYAHIVQVLIDVILWMYPFMSLSTGMTPFLGIFGTGFLTLFYQGLFDLAKQFLDPYDNESYGKGDDPICVDTLISETNAGSVRWLNGLSAQPLAYQNLVDGNFVDHQLPIKGWTVEEADRREEIAIQEAAQKEMEIAQMIADQETQIEPEPPILPIAVETRTPIMPSIMPETPDIVDDERLLNGDLCGEDDEYCAPETELSMTEALEKIEACAEKVP